MGSPTGEGVHVKRYLLRRLLVLLFAICPAVAIHAETVPLPHGRRIKDIVADKFPRGNVFVGATTGWGKLQRKPQISLVLEREFSYVTPENDYKQSTAHPAPGKWNWEPGDRFADYCRKHGQVMRLHGPISPQASTWAKADDRTAAELRTNLDEYMTAQCKRYNGKKHIKWMDVVNETVDHKGGWFAPKPGVDKWENPWPKIGYDKTHALRPPLYIKMAFRIATKHAPDIKLIYNHHGDEPKAWARIKKTIKYLRDQGLRVDGIGWQAHVSLGWEQGRGKLEWLDALIAWAHANKLSFHITENNVFMKRKKDEDAQAKTFAAIMRVLLKHRRGGEVSWNVWNFSDADQWVQTSKYDGCIFARDYRPKPAYYALQKLLENPPPTK
jgi:endo-1,4-beta-xylanase